MNWIRQFLSRGRLDRDLSEEIQEHLHEKADDLVAGGMAREEALRTARREFGNVTLLEERGREVWRWTAIEDFFSDIRFALRQLRKAPAFALAGALTLALGIGLNTAVFSVVNAVILRPLPYAEPDRLVSVQSRHISGAPFSLCYPTFFDFRNGNRVFEHVVSYRSDEFVLTEPGRSVHLHGAIVSWDLFPLLQVQPALGRGFLPGEEEAGARVVVLSHGLWKTRFGGDAAIVGRTISIDRQPHTVIGVAPEGFSFPIMEPAQLWSTLARDAASATLQAITRQRGARMLRVTARLKPGVSLEQAQVEMDGIAAALSRQYPDSNRAVPATYIKPELERLVGDVRRPFLVLLGAVGLVLLITCANVANLLLARTAEREREFALRAAIGARRGRIVRQVITESLVLSLLGCAAGVAAATSLLRLLPSVAADSIPRIQQATVDGRVLGFSIALAVLTAVLFSLAPAVRLMRVEFAGPLKEGARGSTAGSDRLGGALVVGQIALGLVLLGGASLLIASFLHLTRRDLGLRPEGVVAFSLSLPGSEYHDARQLEFHARLLERLRSLPGVSSAALGMPLPLTGSHMSISFKIEGRPTAPHERPRSDMAIVSPAYFRTVGVPLLQGREFTERDDVGAPPVLIVNHAFADKFFPGESAVGKRIEPGASSDKRGTLMREIVGVVGNAKQAPLRLDFEPIYYFPYRQLPWCCPFVVVRASGSPVPLESSIRELVGSLDNQLAVDEVRRLDRFLSMGVAGPRFLMLLLGSFAAIALLLTVVGLYGVLAYSVARRTREIGVRIALGAGRDAVLVMVLRKAAILVVLGVSIGLAGALAGCNLLGKMLYGIGPRNPLLLAFACGLVVLTAAAAAYLPARRAASIDPIEALRSE